MTQARTCYTCGSTFYSDYSFSFKCSTCQQTDKLAEQSQLNRKLEAARLEVELIKSNDEKNKIAAIERQTQAIFETSIKPKEAFNRGFNYIDQELSEDNELNIKFQITEEGEYTFSYDGSKMYITPKLCESFIKGLESKLDSLPKVDFDYLKRSAKSAAKDNARGILSSCFCLYTGLEINGEPVFMVPVETNFKSWIDESDGTLCFSYDFPFESQELNDAYVEGATEAFDELNTPELMQSRLDNEIAKLKAERQLQKDTEEEVIRQRKNIEDTYTLYSTLTWLFPLISIPLFWIFTNGGLTAFLLLVIVPIITGALHYGAEQYKNKQYFI